MSMAEKVMLESARVRPLPCPGIGCAKRLFVACSSKDCDEADKNVYERSDNSSEWWVYYNGSKGSGWRKSGSAIIGLGERAWV